jgi:hypothetical protein
MKAGDVAAAKQSQMGTVEAKRWLHGKCTGRKYRQEVVFLRFTKVGRKVNDLGDVLGIMQLPYAVADA